MASREIPFFDYPALFTEREEELMSLLRSVLSRGAYILQKDLQDFEKNLENFLDVKHVLGVADGTNALKLGLLSIGINPGDEVIVPAHTYVASAAAIHYVGATPVFVECGVDHLIDPSSVIDAITSKTKAIMPVQLNGRTANMAAICQIAEQYDLKIIEDAAQALGSKFQDQSAGSFGNIGTFSFYPAKLLGCFGDGGAVVTNDNKVAENIFLLRDHGRNKNGDVVRWGTNSRLDNMQAAVLNFKLKFFVDDISRRREIAQRYQNAMDSLDAVILPPAPGDDNTYFDVYQNYEIEADRRDDLQFFLKSKGIGTIIQFGGKAVHQHPLGFDHVKLPYTEKLYTKLLLLPMHPALSNADVDYIIDRIHAFYN